MAKEVFGRHEAKYALDSETFAAFHKEIQRYLELDHHNKDGERYKIYNLYADTKDNNVIRKSLAKPKYKEKIRIRSYNEFNKDDIVFVEVKKKYNKFVNKRRTKMKFDQAVNFVEQGIVPPLQPYMNEQVIKELKYSIDRDQLYLKLYLTYERIAYFSIEQKDLRITFDTNIIAKREGEKPVSLLKDGIWLMEIKAEKAFPFWLVKLLAKHKIYKQSFSKYGKEYEHFISEHRSIYSGYQMNYEAVKGDTTYARHNLEFEY